MNQSLLNTFSGVQINVIPSLKTQNRAHKKKRINKKWAKRYGYKDYDRIEDNKTYVFDGIMYMNQKTYDKFRDMIEK